MNRRPAITLIEALMAIFVMAIGLLALLTLFPLGASEMAQSLKDERTAQAANNAVALFKAFDLANDANINAPNPTFATISNFENPWPGTTLPTLSNGFTPTYPIYLDPIGVFSLSGVFQPNTQSMNVGGLPLGIKRISPGTGLIPTNPMSSNNPNMRRWCTLLDDITFDQNGVPLDPASGVGNTGPSPPYGLNAIQREGRYTYAYMVRRQIAMQPQPTIVPRNPQPFPAMDLTVVVYSGRTAGPDILNNTPLGETAYPNTTFLSSNLIRIDYSNGPSRPNLRRGFWVLDARMTGLSNGAVVPQPQGYFYRVVSVNDVSSTQMEVELQTALGGSIRNPLDPITLQPIIGPIVVMEGVSEVFEKGVSY